MAMKGPVDALLFFGEAAVASATSLPNTLEVNMAQTERMSVKGQVTEKVVGGTDITLTLKGGNTASSVTTAVSAKTIAVADLDVGAEFVLPIPDGVNFSFYKVDVTKTGSPTAGKVTAYVDVYQGL